MLQVSVEAVDECPLRGNSSTKYVQNTSMSSDFA